MLDGEHHTLRIDRHDQQSGFTIARGTLDERYPIKLVTDGRYVAGSIHLDTMTIMLEPTAGVDVNGDPTVSLRVRDTRDNWRCDAINTRTPSGVDAQDANHPQGSGSRSVQTVRLLVGWSSNIAGNFVIPDAAAMTTLIQAWIVDVNDAFDDSAVASSVRLELAGTARLPRANSSWYTGDCLSLLSGADDGLWDDIHTLRNTLDADLVAFLSDVDGTPNTIGTGYTAGSFSVTDFYRGDSETLAHELGHNFGCSHDPDNDSSPYLPYGRGYIFMAFTPTGSLLPSRTIMAYGGNAPTWTYSNPDVLFYDFFGHRTIPGGTVTNNNARVIRERAGITGSRRPLADFSAVGVAGSGWDQLIWDLRGSTPTALRDLDHNHRADICELNASTDRNNNGILDDTEDGSTAYELPERFNAAEFGALGGLPGLPRFGSISVPSSAPAPSGSVNVTMHARGDLNATSEYITVSFDGLEYEFFADASDSYDPSSECASIHTDTITISHSAWTSMIADGSINVTFQPTAGVDEIVCGSRELGSWASIEFSYAIGPQPSWDRDLDGVPNYLDGCPDDPNKADPGICGCGEVDVDMNGDGVCDTDCPADLAPPFGTLDFFDVSVFLNAFNANGPAADFNGDGTLDFFDVSAFLVAYQSGCP
ncbi:MAG: GC-type dockerin domain-anchored protein [Phycisphaerales bacterium]